MGKKALMTMIEDGTAKTSGDTSIIQKLASTLVLFEMGFEIMPGTKGEAPESDLNPFEVGPLVLVSE